MIPIMIPINTLTTTLTKTSQNTIILNTIVGVPTALRILYIYNYSLHLFLVYKNSSSTDRVFITPESNVMNLSR
jgi:hypothetical protein